MTLRKSQIFIDPRALFYLQLYSKERLEFIEYVQSPVKCLYDDYLRWVYTQRNFQEYGITDFHAFETRASKSEGGFPEVLSSRAFGAALERLLKDQRSFVTRARGRVLYLRGVGLKEEFPDTLKLEDQKKEHLVAG